jgi:preprotein translocase subunit SecA
MNREELEEVIFKQAETALKEREDRYSSQALYHVSRIIYLQTIDDLWKGHLREMDSLREGISLRGYAQKDPKQEYKKEGYNMFVTLLARVSSNVVMKLMSAQVRQAEEDTEVERAKAKARHEAELALAQARHGADVEPLYDDEGEGEPAPVMVPEAPPVTGEMECPCGSGKPFSQCHGADDEDEDVDQATA